MAQQRMLPQDEGGMLLLLSLCFCPAFHGVAKCILNQKHESLKVDFVKQTEQWHSGGCCRKIKATCHCFFPCGSIHTPKTPSVVIAKCILDQKHGYLLVDCVKQKKGWHSRR